MTSEFPSIGIIVPTMGRRTLIRTLYSFASNLLPQDQVHVVTDGVLPEVRDLVSYFDAAYHGYWICHSGVAEDACWGHPFRNFVLDFIETDYVWTIDDDDIAAPGTLDRFRRQTADWAIYKMEFREGHPANGITCWRWNSLQNPGDIGTPMILARPSTARFGLRYEGDWDYVSGLNKQFGGPAWCEDVVALIRPREDEWPT